MTAMSTFMSTDHPHLQPELFRPALQYPSHPYAELLTRTAQRYPEQEAVLFRDVNLTYRELDALAKTFPARTWSGPECCGTRYPAQACVFVDPVRTPRGIGSRP